MLAVVPTVLALIAPLAVEPTVVLVEIVVCHIVVVDQPVAVAIAIAAGSVELAVEFAE